ncbi:hypothetical protein [Actinomadura madurae]|uniref:hypothetical protein n=1 Tax=Actinomadura madurae TaxID=1993 RepID=UPI0020D22DA7|nr:hypothetical protein [Actinomadura madurae]MCQ0009059.1 hypothetical protein [Actinomadura madurae]
MIEFLLVPAGLVVGLLVAPMAAPYVGEVSRRGRVVVGLVTAALFGLLGWRAGLEPVLPALLYLAAAAPSSASSTSRSSGFPIASRCPRTASRRRSSAWRRRSPTTACAGWSML